MAGGGPCEVEGCTEKRCKGTNRGMCRMHLDQYISFKLCSEELCWESPVREGKCHFHWYADDCKKRDLCSAENCQNVVSTKSNGYCSTHNWRLKHWGQLSAEFACQSCGQKFERKDKMSCNSCLKIERQKRANETAKKKRQQRKVDCGVDGCAVKVFPKKLRGMCKFHYNEWKSTEVCSFGMCMNLIDSLGLCSKHVQQLRSGRLGKKCQDCGVGLPDKHKVRCVSCSARWELEKTKQWNRHGISEVIYWTILALQDYKCADCGESVFDHRRIFVIDHDHSCCSGSRSCGNCVRAILCMQCNAGRGMFQDDPSVMRRAADNLEKSQIRREFQIRGYQAAVPNLDAA